MSTFTNSKVTVTIDGVKKQIGPGWTSLAELVREAGLSTKTAKLTVNTAAASQSSTINGNDSYNFQGGEVLTSTVSA